MDSENTNDILSKLQTDLSTFSIQTVTRLANIERHLEKMNGSVSNNASKYASLDTRLSRLEEAKEWQKRMEAMEREDRIRADQTTSERLWDWVSKNALQVGTLGGVIWALIEILAKKGSP